MSRNTVRAAAVVTVAALLTGTTTATAFGATGSEEVNPPTPIESPNGTYIVLLEEDPVATYDGGEAGLRATKPADGEKLDTRSPEVEEYAGYLEERQQDVAAETGVSPEATYQITLNGFSARMSPQEAAKVAGAKGVVGVYPDEIRHPVAVPSTEFLGLEGSGGVWESLGGEDAAGEGVVVGVVDTGIAPEHPSFAGEPLGSAPGDEPYLEGDDVVFAKADGDQFRATRVTGQDWGLDDYSTKLIGAKYFSTGAANAGFDFSHDYLSPRDGDGHGSHTAGTAAGNTGVDAAIGGIAFGAVSSFRRRRRAFGSLSPHSPGVTRWHGLSGSAASSSSADASRRGARVSVRALRRSRRAALLLPLPARSGQSEAVSRSACPVANRRRAPGPCSR